MMGCLSGATDLDRHAIWQEKRLASRHGLIMSENEFITATSAALNFGKIWSSVDLICMRKAFQGNILTTWSMVVGHVTYGNVETGLPELGILRKEILWKIHMNSCALFVA